MANTVSVYCTPEDVRKFIQLKKFIDANSVPTANELESLIVQVEGTFEQETGHAYKPVFVTEERHDFESLQNRHKEIFDSITVPRPVHLFHRPVLPFNASRGHKIEVYEGSEPWTDWLTAKTEGRNRDWWLDEQKGILYIRKTFIPRRNAAVRITYEWGRPIATITDNPLSSSATTINLSSTKHYQFRGWVRIGKEYIFYTGKTATTLTGCTRAQFGTEAAQHSQGSEAYQVPDNVRHLMVKKVAAEYLANSRFIDAAAEGSNAAYAISKAVDDWNREWETAIKGGQYRKQRVF